MTMNARALILTIVALLLASVTIFLVRSYLQNNQPRPVVEAQREGPKVLVARQNLTIGHIIDTPDLEWISWPDDDISRAYLTEGDTRLADFVGHVVRHGIIAGEPITAGRLVSPGDRGYLAVVLAPGMRAIAIPVDRSSGVAGFVFPGDRIDLIVTHEAFDPVNEEAYILSETIMHNVRVLAVDTETDDQGNQPLLAKTVTLEVTPALAETVAVAMRFGSLSISLRGITSPDGTEQTAVSRDESLPDNINTTMTWAADVSVALQRPRSMDQGISTMIIVTRGSAREEVMLDGGNP
jgi:pilus assembly protein CpaB